MLRLSLETLRKPHQKTRLQVTLSFLASAFTLTDDKQSDHSCLARRVSIGKGAHARPHPGLETPELATTEQDRVTFEPQ